MLVSPVQFWNRYCGILVIPSSKVTVLRFEQPMKGSLTELPSAQSEAGILIEVSEVQFLNA